eukprot:13492454-Alexandrium_andersonii.AAC.1
MSKRPFSLRKATSKLLQRVAKALACLWELAGQPRKTTAPGSAARRHGGSCGSARPCSGRPGRSG